ncbi:MAG TPA: pyridoxal-phosphate dependent enzyme [Candidatus Binatia bacterium]|nr:pyridoxal-phosphate dependent enzyme [Candidatus Binatia bacterium]
MATSTGGPDLPSLPELPRVALLAGPTPLQPMPRLSAALGGRAELWIKREDLGPLAFSGNKLRNLEFLLGRALENGADTVITSGRRWSNHCRLTAAAGARLGLAVHVVVSGPPVEASANLRLMRELGATIHQAATDAREERESLVEQVAAAAAAEGRRVSVLPVGGSSPVGAWGQVLAALEALEQARAAGIQPSTIVLPSATGGTQAGLIVGAAVGAAPGNRAATASVRVEGVAVHPDPALRARIEGLVASLSEMAGIEPPAEPVALDASWVGPGYGLPTAASEEASGLLARTEGILADPVYTAKGLAGLVAGMRAGALDGRQVIFWHGGGLPALFEPALGR